MMKNKIGLLVSGSAVLGSLLLTGVASAQTTTQPPAASQAKWNGPMMKGHMPPGVFGTVSAISGNDIIITSKGKGETASTKTYTVDATNATVTKNGATAALSSIAVGDMISAQGTVTGTTVAATAIRDGMPARTPGQQGPRAPMAQIQGNGQPVIGGTISAISGSTLTVTNKSNVTYTVDATNATVLKSNATSTLSAVAVGDNVIVQGAVQGSAVTASSVIDSGAPKSTGQNPQGGIGGFLGGIGSFFKHIFGFF